MMSGAQRPRMGSHLIVKPRLQGTSPRQYRHTESGGHTDRARRNTTAPWTRAVKPELGAASRRQTYLEFVVSRAFGSDFSSASSASVPVLSTQYSLQTFRAGQPVNVQRPDQTFREQTPSFLAC